MNFRFVFFRLSIAAILTMVAMPLFADDIPHPRIEGGRVLLDIPKTCFYREYLLSECVSKTDHYKWMEVGTRPSTLHVRLEKAGDVVWLRRINTSVVGNPVDSLSIQSIRDNNMDGYLMRFPIISSDDEGAVTIDATDLFFSDHILSPFSSWFSKAKVAFDPKLSYVASCKSFSDNFSVRSILSFSHDEKSRERPKICSAEVVSSMLLLPEQKMRPRLGDNRIGLFTTDKKRLDFEKSDFIEDIEYVERWRVEPSDYEAWKRGETVTPKQQIIYYVDNAFPENWKEPIRRGVLDWNDAFERIGLKDVIAVRDYPTDDPEFDENNLKYSCIRYIPTDRGGAQGPSWTDPTTGEVLSASVYVWGSMLEIMNRFCYVQTAHVNPAIRSGKFPEDLLASTIQITLAHEIGHTLGLAHNMGGSAVYPTDSLLKADFVRQHGITASTMDYVFYNYIVPVGNTDIPLMSTRLGDYDRMLIDYIYRPTHPSLSLTDDYAVVEKRLDKYLENPYCHYGRQQWGNGSDPTSLIYDLGNDPIKTGSLSITNLKYVLNHLEEWLPGGDNARLRKNMYESLIEHYEVLMRSVAHNVGGIRVNLTDSVRNRHNKSVPRQIQHESVEWLAKHLRQSNWLNNKQLLSTLPLAQPPSVTMLANIASDIVKRSSKIVLSSSLSDDPYTLSDYMNDLYMFFFDVPKLSDADKILQRALLRSINEEGNKNLGKDSDIHHISEGAGAWKLLQERICELSEKRLKGTTDKLHWTMVYSLTKPSQRPE